MINKFKWLLLVSIVFAACSDDDNDSTTVVQEPVTAGSADFSNYVALGNSLTAGFSDGALYKAGQETSWTKILSDQFALAGGGEFRIPFVNDNVGGLLLNGMQITENRLIFNGSAPVRLIGTPTTDVTAHLTGPFNNMGVPGAKSYHLLAPNYGNIAGLPGAANPYFVRFASTPSASVVQDAVAQNPTFFTLWIGNNDVLGYATSGGDGSDPITPPTGAPGVGFDGTYNTIVGALVGTGAKGVLANIPYVTTIPFFTTVPSNPLTASAIGGGNVAVGEATIDQLNAQLYGPLKTALTAFGAGDRVNLLSATGANPLLIKDESLTDLSAQLTMAFTPTLGAQTAAFYGQVFGQARHANANDLVLLTTQGAIGAAPVGIPAPLNRYGITYPLEDKHILIPTEIAELKAATDAYNATISAAASTNGLAFVDANALLTRVHETGIPYEGYTLGSALVFGGAFSLDGVHPTARGYALIANEFSKAINLTYGSTLPMVRLTDYPTIRPQSF